MTTDAIVMTELEPNVEGDDETEPEDEAGLYKGTEAYVGVYVVFARVLDHMNDDTMEKELDGLENWKGSWRDYSRWIQLRRLFQL